MKRVKRLMKKDIQAFQVGMLILLVFSSNFLFTQNLDSLWVVWNNSQRADTSRMKAMKDIAWHTTIYINADSGEILARELMDFAIDKNNLKIQATCLKTIGLASYLRSNYKEALQYYDKALIKAYEAEDKVEVSNILNNIGVSNKALGNYDKALESHFKSLKIKEELGLKRSMSFSYNNIGVIYSIQRNHPMAIEYFHKNLKICEELNMVPQIASANLNIGLLYIEQENYKQALEYLIKSEEPFKALNHKFGLCTLYNSIGVVYKGLGDLEKANEYYQKSLALATELDNRPLIGNVYRNLGNVYLLQDNTDEAMKSFRKNLEINLELGEKRRIVAAKIDIGALHLDMNQPLLAKKWCEEAYLQAIEYNYLEEIMSSCKYLNRAYKQLGDINKAYRFQEEYYASRDSLDKLENEVEVTSLLMKYKYEKQHLADSLAMVEERLNTKLIYQENINREKDRQRTFLFGGIIVLIIAGMLYIWLLSVRKNNKRLEEKNKLIEFEKQRAEELEHSKEIFFSNVSHELRTPLTLILGPLDNLINQTENVDIKRELDIMRRNANRLYSMINELLELYKLESGKIKLSVRKIEFVSLVHRLVQSFEPLVNQKKINLHFNTDVNDCFVYVDSEKIEKVISNLLSNAFKFTDLGGEIIIDLACVNNDEFIEIRVSDNGIGIPNDKVENVFDRFYQVNDSDKRGYEGTGIGLSLTKELVELHQGEIRVESEVGRGSTFIIKLHKGSNHLKEDEIVIEDPLRVVPVLKTDLTEPISSIEAEDTEHIKKTESKSVLPLVLIVEDNADMRGYIRSCLDIKIYKIIESKDGIDGLNKAIEKIPDLIISDVMMPRMDGNEMCSKIKTDERTSHIPVVLVTARASIEHKIKGIETGADAYLAKPFNAMELQSWVKKLIEQRKKLRQSFMKNFSPGLNIKHQEITSVDQQFIKKAVNTVEKYISDSEFSVEKFGQEMALSRVQLHRKLKALTDQSTSHFIRTIRLKNAANYLIKKGANVKETAYEFGFNNLSYFDKCFHKEFGMTPTDYVASHKS